MYAAKALLSQYDEELRVKVKTAALCSSLEPTTVGFNISKENFNMIANNVKSKSSNIIEKIEDKTLKESTIIPLPIDSVLDSVTTAFDELKINRDFTCKWSFIRYKSRYCF